MKDVDLVVADLDADISLCEARAAQGPQTLEQVGVGNGAAE